MNFMWLSCQVTWQLSHKVALGPPLCQNTSQSTESVHAHTSCILVVQEECKEQCLPPAPGLVEVLEKAMSEGAITLPEGVPFLLDLKEFGACANIHDCPAPVLR